MPVALVTRVGSSSALATVDRGGNEPHGRTGHSLLQHVSSRPGSRDTSPARVVRRDSSSGMTRLSATGQSSQAHSHLFLLESSPGSPAATARAPFRSAQHSPVHTNPQQQHITKASSSCAAACTDDEEEFVDGPVALGSKDEDPLAALLPRNVVRPVAPSPARSSASQTSSLLALIEASINPRASLDDRESVPVAPTNPFGLGTSLPGLAQRPSTGSGRSAGPTDAKAWLSAKLEQAKRHRWVLTGASVIWVVLNLHQWKEADLTSSSDTVRTILDVLMNGPQMAQILRELSQFGLAVLIAIVNGKAPPSGSD